MPSALDGITMLLVKAHEGRSNRVVLSPHRRNRGRAVGPIGWGEGVRLGWGVGWVVHDTRTGGYRKWAIRRKKRTKYWEEGSMGSAWKGRFERWASYVVRGRRDDDTRKRSFVSARALEPKRQAPNGQSRIRLLIGSDPLSFLFA